MPLLKPDPTFYPSPKMAMQSAPEKLAYVALINPKQSGQADAMGVVDRGPRLEGLRPLDRSDRHAAGGRRAASLRLERVQLVPLSLRARTRTWNGAT